MIIIKNLSEKSEFDYYEVIKLQEYTFSWKAIFKLLAANKTAIPKWMNVVRAVSSEGFGRIKYNR